MDEERYKKLLIVNESTDAQVTLYLYATWDFICWCSWESHIIKPNEKYLHRSSKGFKFKLVARFEDGRRSKQTLQEPEKWIEDKSLKITNSLELTEGRLADFPEEKRVCLRKAQRDKELKSTNGRRNLYEILGLDMNQVRKMPKEDQSKAIKKGFQKEIQRWHPDKNFGDDENAKEIFMAHEILKDEEMRARYHNEADYDNGVLSLKRYKAIFKPERFTEEQKKSYMERMIMFAMSLGITFGGIALSVGSAGLAAPAAVAIGAVSGGGFVGAGMQSLQHTVSRKSVVDECNKKQWLINGGVGFVGGAVTGAAAAGITARVVGLGSAAMESAAVTAGEYVAIGAGSGAVGGAASSLATDAGRKFADGENVTWKQFLGHAVCGAVVGAAAGTAGGAVTKSAVGIQTSTASANFEGELGEQIAILTQRIPRALAEHGAEAAMTSVAHFAEERLDDSVENRNPGDHLVEGVRNAAFNIVKGVAQESGSAFASHAVNKIKVAMGVKNEQRQQLNAPLDPLVDDDTCVVRPHLDEENKNIDQRSFISYLFEKNDEDRINWRDNSRHKFPSYQPLVTMEPSWYKLKRNATFDREEDDIPNQSCFSYEPEDCKLKCIFEDTDDLISKMVVSFFLNGQNIIQEVFGSGESVTVPGNARQLEVTFQVRRPFWRDIKKYDRFKRRWSEPVQPHVFKYNTPPPLRTFIISGGLWCEAVMRVSNEYHDETKEM